MTKTPWLITAAIFLALLLPEAVQQGMFLDGVTYGAIARNMAEGHGAFAAPFYTESVYPVFHEQPPLVLWLQSLLFGLLGDHFWVERFFSLLMALLTAWAITLNWRELTLTNKNEYPDAQIKVKSDGWLPVLFWVAMPITYWCYHNNMLEGVQSFLVLMSTFSWLRHLNTGKLFWQGVAMAAVAAAVLSKGPVGLFPVAAPLAFAISKITLKGISGSVWLATGALGMLLLFVFMIPGMMEYGREYLNTQLLPTMAGAREASPVSRFHWVEDLVSQVALPGILILLLSGKNIRRNIPDGNRKNAFFCFIAGICGSFPLVLTPKQSSHYLLPSLPFFALGLAFLAQHRFSGMVDLLSRQNEKIIGFGAVILLAGVIGYSATRFGRFTRDESLISDISAIAAATGNAPSIGASEGLRYNWLTIAYLMRIGRTSLDYHHTGRYFLTEKTGNLPDSLQNRFVSAPVRLQNFTLYLQK